MRVWALLLLAVPVFAEIRLVVSPTTSEQGERFLLHEVRPLAPRLRVRVTIDDDSFYRGSTDHVYANLSGTTLWLLPDQPTASPISLPILSIGDGSFPSLDAYVPENVPLGGATLSLVTRGGTSLSTPIEVRPVQPRLLAANSPNSTYGPAIATRGIGGEPIRLTTPARPGNLVSVEAIGLGLTTADRVRVRLAGVVLPVSVIANPQAPGIDWVSFRVPETGVPDGCFLTVEVEAAGRRSNQLTVPKESGSGPCRHPFGLTAEQLSGLDRGEKVAFAEVAYQHLVRPSDAHPGHFVRSDGLFFEVRPLGAAELAARVPSPTTESWFGCTTSRSDSEDNHSRFFLLDFNRSVDAGPALTVRWDRGTAMMGRRESGWYSLSSSGSATEGSLVSPPPLLPPGPVRLQSTGGRDIAAFDVGLDIPALPSPLGWDGLNAVERGRGLLLRWDPRLYAAGGHMSVSLGVRRDPFYYSPTVTCGVPATAGELHIPAGVLGALPSTAGEPLGVVSMTLYRGCNESRLFTLPLVQGGSVWGCASYFLSQNRWVVVE